MTKTTSFLERLCMLATCLLMLLAIAIGKNGRVLGHELTDTEEKTQKDTSTVSVGPDGTITILSTSFAKDVRGYGGPTPLKLTIEEGKIKQIELLPNAETPSFLKRVEEGIIPQYLGKNIDEAKTMQVDAISGATMSSEAVKLTLRRALDRVPKQTNITESNPTRMPGLKLTLAILVSLAAALLPIWVKSKTYRNTQLVLNVLVLGLYCGTFVSYSSLVSVLSNGIGLSQVGLAILLIVALLYPLIGKRGYYCAWCCPLGSAQELLGKVSKRKWALSPQCITRLEMLQRMLWCVLMLLAWSGILLAWMDYELFSAFLWQSASWVVIGFAILTLLLSVVINRPYCRFICPTGSLLKSL